MWSHAAVFPALVVLLASCGASEDGETGSGGAGGSSGASGSSGAGGTSGASGSSGSSGGSGSAGTAAECTTVADCLLFNDCCACENLAAGEADPPSACPMASCIQSHCDAIGGVAAACVDGRCLLDVTCDLSGVTCKKALPACEDGFVPTAVGNCYGGCVRETECP